MHVEAKAHVHRVLSVGKGKRPRVTTREITHTHSYGRQVHVHAEVTLCVFEECATYEEHGTHPRHLNPGATAVDT